MYLERRIILERRRHKKEGRKEAGNEGNNQALATIHILF